MNILAYAAESCGGSDWTQVFTHAVSDMQAQGGGELRVPAGVYPTGSIRLYSHMTLYLEASAGFFLRNAVEVDLRGVKVRGVQGDWLNIDESVRLEGKTAPATAIKENE